MVKTMPTELTRRASAELEASVCLGQPSGTLRRALFHEVRDIIHEEARHSAEKWHATRLFNTVRQGVRRLLVKQRVVEAMQELVRESSKGSTKQASIPSQSLEPAEATEEKKATGAESEEAEEELPALVEMETNVSSLVETFSKLQHLEESFTDPSAKSSYAKVLASAEKCTKLLCSLSSHTSDMVSDISDLDTNFQESGQMITDLVQRINADIAKMQAVLEKEASSEDNDGDADRPPPKPRTNFMASAAHCLYALGVLKEEQASRTKQRRFAISEDAVRDPEKLLEGSNFNAAWDAAMQRRKDASRRPRHTGNDSDDDDDGAELGSDWLESVLGHVEDDSIEAVPETSLRFEEGSVASRLLALRAQNAAARATKATEGKESFKRKEAARSRDVEAAPIDPNPCHTAPADKGTSSTSRSAARKPIASKSTLKQSTGKRVDDANGIEAALSAETKVLASAETKVDQNEGQVHFDQASLQKRSSKQGPKTLHVLQDSQETPSPTDSPTASSAMATGSTSTLTQPYLSRNYDTRRRTCGPILLRSEGDTSCQLKADDLDDLLICSARTPRRQSVHAGAQGSAQASAVQTQGTRSEGLGLRKNTRDRPGTMDFAQVGRQVSGTDAGAMLDQHQPLPTPTRSEAPGVRRRVSWQSSAMQPSSMDRQAQSASFSASLSQVVATGIVAQPSPRRTRAPADLPTLVGRSDPQRSSSRRRSVTLGSDEFDDIHF